MDHRPGGEGARDESGSPTRRPRAEIPERRRPPPGAHGPRFGRENRLGDARNATKLDTRATPRGEGKEPDVDHRASRPKTRPVKRVISVTSMTVTLGMSRAKA